MKWIPGLNPEASADAIDAPDLQGFMRWRLKFAFWVSALFSPYLVIPFGTVALVASVTRTNEDFLVWTSLCILFTTVIPVVFIIVQIVRGKITDVHVMERHQRSGPFLVAVLSAAIGALVMKYFGARLEIWGVALVFAINGLVLFCVTAWWKISIHVAVLSAAILAGAVMIPNLDWRLVGWTIPLIIWARYVRKRHTAWQGLMGFLVAILITSASIYMLYKLYDISFMNVVRERLL
jgi:hypothetical protein